MQSCMEIIKLWIIFQDDPGYESVRKKESVISYGYEVVASKSVNRRDSATNKSSKRDPGTLNETFQLMDKEAQNVLNPNYHFTEFNAHNVIRVTYTHVRYKWFLQLTFRVLSENRT